MFVFKFQDTTDGKFAFVVAKSEADAREAMQHKTSLELTLVAVKAVEHFKKPIVIFNEVLPF